MKDPGSIALTAVLLLLVATPAFGQLSSGDLLDTVTTTFQEASKPWGVKIQAHATRLFWSLALMSMVWTYGLMALRQADFNEFAVETIKFIFFLGFFLWLLQNGPDFANKIILSLRLIGSEAIGRTDALSPSKIIDIGFDIFFKAVDKVSVLSPVLSAAALVISGCILVVLAHISFGMIQLLCSAWILAYAGVFFLGFGGSRWTSDIAIYYYKTVLGVAAELMTMTLIVGVGQAIMDDLARQNGNDVNIKSLSVMLIAALLLYKLCTALPGRVASIATGGAVSGSGGGGMGAAAMLAGAAVGGMAVAQAAKSIAGGAGAVGTALQAAKAAAANGNGPGGFTGIARGTAGRLASAASSVAFDRASKSLFGSELERAKTFGGQMSEKIQSTSTAMSGTSATMGANRGTSWDPSAAGASSPGSNWSSPSQSNSVGPSSAKPVNDEVGTFVAATSKP